MSFTLQDPAGDTVASNVTYDDATRTATLTHGTVSLDPLTTYTVIVRVTDLAGNAAQASWSFSTTGAVAGATIWDASTAPTVPSANDAAAVELGVKFRSDISGTITGLRRDLRLPVVCGHDPGDRVRLLTRPDRADSGGVSFLVSLQPRSREAATEAR